MFTTRKVKDSAAAAVSASLRQLHALIKLYLPYITIIEGISTFGLLADHPVELLLKLCSLLVS